MRASLAEVKPQSGFHGEANMVRLPLRSFWNHHRRRIGKAKMDRHRSPKDGEKEKARITGTEDLVRGVQGRVVNRVTSPSQRSSRKHPKECFSLFQFCHPQSMLRFFLIAPSMTFYYLGYIVYVFMWYIH